MRCIMRATPSPIATSTIMPAACSRSAPTAPRRSSCATSGSKNISTSISIIAIDPAILRVPAAFLSAQLIQYDYGAGGGPRVGDFYASAAADPAAFVARGDPAAARRRPGGAGDDHPRHARSRPRRARRARRARKRPSGRGSTPLWPPRARPSGAGRCRPSDTMIFDARSPGFAGLTSTARSEVQAAYRVYLAQVEAWQQARALTVFTARLGARPRGRRRSAISRPRSNSASPRCEAGGTARPPLEERASATAAYRRWLACYAPVLEGQPAAAGDLVCARMRAMRSDLALAPRRLALLGRRAAALLLFPAAPARRISGRPGRGFRRRPGRPARPQLRRAARRGPRSRCRSPPRRSTRPSPPAPNGQLAFRCAADWIDADLGLRAPLASGADDACDNAPRSRATLDPARFAPLDDALVLARLALLDQAGVRQVADALRRQSGRAAAWARSRVTRCCSTASARSTAASNGAAPSLPFPRRAAYRSRAARAQRRLCARRRRGPGRLPLLPDRGAAPHRLRGPVPPVRRRDPAPAGDAAAGLSLPPLRRRSPARAGRAGRRPIC